MTERRNIKVDDKTFERYRDEKGEYETWNLALNRILDELEELRDAEDND
jgi:hypothetical protein